MVVSRDALGLPLSLPFGFSSFLILLSVMWRVYYFSKINTDFESSSYKQFDPAQGPFQDLVIFLIH